MGNAANVSSSRILIDAFSEIAEEKSLLRTLLLSSLLMGFFSLLKPFTVQIAINNLLAQGSSQIFSLVGFFAFFLVLSVVTYMMSGNIEQAFYKWFSIRRAYFGVFFRENYFNFTDQDTDDDRQKKVHHFLDLSFQNAQQIPVVAATIPPLFIQILFGLIFIGVIHPFLLFFTIIFLAVLWLVTAVFSPRALLAAIAYHDAKQDLIFRSASELSRSAATQAGTKADRPLPPGISSGAAATVWRQELLDDLDGKQNRLLRITSTQSRILIATAALGNIALLALGLWLVLQDNLTLGQLIAAEIAYSPVLLGALQSGSSLSTTYEVVSNLHLMRRLRRDARAEAAAPGSSQVPLPDVPAAILTRKLRPERAFLMLGLLAMFSAVPILYFMPWVQTVSVEGEVIASDPAAREHDIESPHEGMMTATLATEGQTVSQGQTLAEIRDGARRNRILAPADGIIIETLAYSGSSFVARGEAVFRFLPASEERIIRFQLPADETSLVKVGDPVVIRFPSWPSVQFEGWPSVAISRFYGKVRFVSRMRADGKQPYIDVEPADAAGYLWPGEDHANIGTPVQGHIQIGTVSVGHELWRQINGMPKQKALD